MIFVEIGKKRIYGFKTKSKYKTWLLIQTHIQVGRLILYGKERKKKLRYTLYVNYLNIKCFVYKL